MIRTTMVALITLVPTIAIGAQVPAPSVTLYSTGMSLVRRTVPVGLPSGTTTQSLPLGLLDPASLAVLTPGVTLESVLFDGADGENALLRRNIGQIFKVAPGEDQLAPRARLLAVAPERWQLLGPEGDTPLGVVFTRPGRLIWPADLVPVAPTVEATITSDRSRNSLALMYQVPGATWRARYRLVIGSDASLAGNAVITTGVLDLTNASVQLLAGDIGDRPRPAPAPVMAKAMAQEIAGDYTAGLPSSLGVPIGQARLFDLPGKVTFVPGTELVHALFEPASVEVKLHLVVPGGIRYRGPLNPQDDDQQLPVMASYRLPHTLGTDFGELALPGGSVEIYDRDDAGRLQLVGAGAIGHVAPGDSVEVSAGSSFDVTAYRTQLTYDLTRRADPEVPGRTMTVVEASYRVTVRNARDSVAVVEVQIDRAGDWELLSSSVPARQISSTRTVLPITVPARGETTVEYRLRATW